MRVRTPSRTERSGTIVVLLLMALLFLSGCNEETILRDLDQTQANRAVTTLGGYGIAAVARKGTGSSSKYYVEVDREYYGRALAILNSDQGWQSAPESFQDITSQRGIIPNSREMELLRLDHALGSEIERLIQNLPGVKLVEVVVRSNLTTEGAKPSVSAVIIQYPGSFIDRAEVTKILLGIVPGLKEEQINILLKQRGDDKVVLSENGVENVNGKVVVEPLTKLSFPIVGSYRVAKGDRDSLVTIFSLIFVLVALAAGCFGFMLGYNYELMKGAYSKKNTASKAREGA